MYTYIYIYIYTHIYDYGIAPEVIRAYEARSSICFLFRVLLLIKLLFIFFALAINSDTVTRVKPAFCRVSINNGMA
jgi:hypothetical protein